MDRAAEGEAAIIRTTTKTVATTRIPGANDDLMRLLARMADVVVIRSIARERNEVAPVETVLAKRKPVRHTVRFHFRIQ